MSQIETLKHELGCRLEEILSAKFTLTFTTSMGPFTSSPPMSFERLREELELSQRSQEELTASFRPGCDYFSLIRANKALRQRIAGIRTSADSLLEWARSFEISGAPALEPG